MRKFKSKVTTMFLITLVFSVFPVVLPTVSADPDWKEEIEWLATDVNYDGKVNMKDIYFIIMWFGDYCPDADVNCDTKVNMKDIYAGILHFGKQTTEITIEDSTTLLTPPWHFRDNVTIPYPLKEIVILSPPCGEVLRALEYEPGDRRDLVVGASYNIIGRPGYWPVMSTTVNVSASAHGYPDVTAIIALDSLTPDVPMVVFWYGTHPATRSKIDDLVAELDPFGISVVGLDCYKYETLFDDMETWGIILGRRCKLNEIHEFFNEVLETAANRTSDIPENQKCRVYGEHHGAYPGKWKSFGPGAPWHDMMEMAGVKNIFENKTSTYPTVTCEEVVAGAPEVMISDTRIYNIEMGYCETNETAMQNYLDDWSDWHRNDCIDPNQWNSIPAVQDGCMYLSSQDLGSGPEKIFLVLYVADICYPDRFSQHPTDPVDPEDYFRTWIEEYQHLSYCGIFMYPEDPCTP